MKVVIAGGGIAGNCMLRQLRNRPDVDHVRAYEKRSLENASPPGLNVIMNHNGLAAISETDPELYASFQKLGFDMVNWSARTVSGEVLYHLEDVVSSGLASKPAMVARWDQIHEATRCDDLTEYSSEVTDVKEQEDGKVSVQIRRNGSDEQIEWIENVDLLLACDGRYSAVREKLKPAVSSFGPPYVGDFRIVMHDQKNVSMYLTNEAPCWRVYHKPNLEKIVEKFGDHPAIVAAASGYVRVGLMKLTDSTIGAFGNVAIPGDGKVDDKIKSGEFLASVFESDDNSPPDTLGQLAIDMLRNYGDGAHWARKQETDTCYEALDGKVLFLGDSAGAIYPSLGQGANLALEDAAVASAAFPNVSLIAQLRLPRREFIKDMSKRHAAHVAFPDKFDKEIDNWANPNSKWRAELRELWCCGQQLALRAELATKENVSEFGQLIGEALDGGEYDPATTDAALDLSKGAPRFYLMKLEGGRPLKVDRITRHRQVTQCLGSLGLNEYYYLVVHAPTDTPTLEGLRAVCIPPRHYLKLNVGTWHAGPLWSGDDDARTFMNLELADTNVVDHDTVFFANLPPYRLSNCDDGNKADDKPLVIPVMSVDETSS